MFNKILIANRGEIACRIIRTAERMGIQTVALYSDADKNSLHAKLATEAYYAGPSKAQESYLNIENIIRIAQSAKVEAIHPGYGFLSENPQFAKACDKAGIVFIGPPIDAMETMASKQISKQKLEHSGVPLTPGYHGMDQSDECLLTEAQKIGFPVLLKAASGGGGKGMRTVYDADSFKEALAGAKREAMASFDDNTMIIEKLILHARHVEVQIMADNHGHVVHLFERDCSIQRRHQKIIEEAPASHLPDKVRQTMTEAACNVARSIHYRGAGTVEFLYDGQESFYFMEMNTRLQVEHPVTEMITGEDLVAWQFRIAAGEALPCRQEDIKATDYAIECRIYAEDPFNQFLPSTGCIQWLKEPSGEGVRIDSGVQCGSEISRFYDPMIAKLITKGRSRDEALLRMRRALDEYLITGVKSNLPFLKSVLKHPRFAAADIDTGFLSDEHIELSEPDRMTAAKICAAWDYMQLTQNKDPLEIESFAWQMHLSSHWTWYYRIHDESMTVRIFPQTLTQFQLEYEHQLFNLNVTLSGEDLCITDDLMLIKASVLLKTDAFIVSHGGETFHVVREQTLKESTDSEKQAGHLYTAPMPANVVAVLKSKGDHVQKGELLMILEAMKMEHSIHATRDGILTELFYTPGDQVNEGSELLVLEAL